ncbi:hypothetical protein AC578_6240 [Pseudocercospora eumusae]|uniref:Uncharacterized protein n=1 Tax=Pseudocercospora eumusae TaxID=321146 RepID=A0A139GZP5_9PEZI|nr:hypothetical protein AC578_6240 [Pseudocercospora eumusae]
MYISVSFVRKPFGPVADAWLTAVLCPRNANNRNKNVPTNSPVHATIWFLHAGWRYASRGSTYPNPGSRLAFFRRFW